MFKPIQTNSNTRSSLFKAVQSRSNMNLSYLSPEIIYSKKITHNIINVSLLIIQGPTIISNHATAEKFAEKSATLGGLSGT